MTDGPSAEDLSAPAVGGVGEPGAGLAIITVNYGSADLLAANLVPLSEALPGGDVVVVDNHKSDQDTAEVSALATSAGWRLIVAGANIGFGAGMNRAAAAAIEAGARDLLLLNPDAAISPEALARLREQLDRDRSVVWAPQTRTAIGGIRSSGRYLRLSDGTMEHPVRSGPMVARPGAMPWLSAACLLVDAGMWQRSGGFGEDYFLYWEDVELSASLIEAGADLAISDSVSYMHDQGGTQEIDNISGSGAKSDLYYYYNVRNRLIYADRNLDPAQSMRWRRSALRAAYRTLRRGGRRQFLHPVGPMSAVWAGLRDGRRLRTGPRPARLAKHR